MIGPRVDPMALAFMTSRFWVGRIAENEAKKVRLPSVVHHIILQKTLQEVNQIESLCIEGLVSSPNYFTKHPQNTNPPQ